MIDHECSRRGFLKLVGGGLATYGWPAGNVFAAGTDDIKLGYPANLTGAVAIIGEGAGIFSKAGAHVSFERFNSGVAVRDAMISNRVDVGIMNATPFVIGVAKGTLAGLAVATYAGRIIMVVAGKDSGIKSVADLKGKRVGSQVGSGTDHVFRNKVLAKYGLKPSDVQIVNVKFTDQVSALASHSIDAYAGTEPYSSIAEYEGIGQLLVDYGEFDLSPIMLAVNQPVLERKRDGIVLMLKGWLETVRFAKEHTDEAADVIWKFYKDQGYDVPKAVVRSALNRMDLNPDFVQQLPAYLTEQAQILLSKGRISRMPDWNKELLQAPIARARELIGKA